MASISCSSSSKLFTWVFPCPTLQITGGSLPYNVWKGLISVEEWGEVLYENSAHRSQEAQVFGLPMTKHLKYVSTALLTISDCPSVCRWYDVLLFNSVPWRRNSSCQKLLINILSRSEIMDPGKPCKRTTFLMKASATIAAVNGRRKAIKWAYFVKRSTTTRIEFTPFDNGSHSIKSMVISSQTRERMCKGCKKPAGDWW